MGQKQLSPRLKAGLDAARVVAACYVVLHHLFTTKSIVFRFGSEAVLVFFLLSGFVIFANERVRALHPRGYYLRRFRRIYPVLLFAMAVSTAVAIDNGDLFAQYSGTELLGTLASVQDVSAVKPGVITDPYMGNDPLWSVSYEVAFYLIFPVVLLAWNRNPKVTNHVIGATCCALYVIFALHPNHFALVGAYFLVWWCGAMAANAYVNGSRSFIAIGAPLIWLVALVAISAIVVVMVGLKGIGYYPFLPLRHFAVAVTLIAVFYGPLGIVAANAAYRIKVPVAKVASISFGIYALHYPLLIHWDRATEPFWFAFAILLTVALAFVAEHQIYRIIPKAPST